MSATVNRACTLLGVGFLALGVLTLLGIAAQARFGGAPQPLSALYAGLNLLISYGFFSRQYWVYPAIAANLGGSILLALVRGLSHPLTGTQLTVYLITIGVNLALAVAAYAMRKRLDGTLGYVGGIFLVLWAVILCYTLLKELV